MSKFANALFTRLEQVKPSIKFRYLKAGIEIVGDHPQAYEARKVFDYYKDLVTEIQLETKVDGADLVGHEQPFGLFVNLRHTREIERESGGFRPISSEPEQFRVFYYYNFGRPLENYRDKFQEAAKQALQEHFEVMSVTFQDEKVNSRATSDYGWRVTPYAYLLLKARSPKVDKVPPLRLDLDFMDTSAMSCCRSSRPRFRSTHARQGVGSPFEKLQLTQTLDERQAAQGKLIVEIKAAARGLIPDLDQLVSLNQPGSSTRRSTTRVFRSRSSTRTAPRR